MNTHTVEDQISPSDAANEVVTPIEAVTALLIAGGHPNPQLWLQELHPDAFATNNDSIQRFLINRYWRMQLQKLDENTIDARFCLVDEAHVKTVDWLRVFKEGVLPCILSHQLPKVGA